jgi:NADH-quinone oxidoreductase subunit H
MDSTIIIEKVYYCCSFALTMLMAMYSTWAERKVAAWLQDRVEPNRAGPFGLFQPLADGLKIILRRI